MRVRDFAAELISEMAEGLDWLVYKYECTAKSSGSITFELEIGEDDEDDEVECRYKILDYSGHLVTLNNPLGNIEIDLHRAGSVIEIREWFEDIEKSYEHPFGDLEGALTGFNYPFSGGHTHSIVTTETHSHGWATSPDGIIWDDSTAGTTISPVSVTTPVITVSTVDTTVPNSGGSLTVGLGSGLDELSTGAPNNNNIFQFNPTYGSLSFTNMPCGP